MKRPEEYTRKELNDIWNSNEPDSMKFAYAMMEIKCSYHEQQVKNLSLGNVSKCYTCHTTKGDLPKGDNYCNMCDHYF